MFDTERYYKILELPLGSSFEEVHQSYRDLVTVWHPDRFVHYPRLQKKAHHKIQEINEAHEQLRCLKKTSIATDSSTQSSAKSSPSPQESHAKVNVEDFYQQKVHQPQQSNTTKNNNYHQQSSYQSNYKDLHTWLD
ncbi:MAG TPA: J domain-containing protein [Oculatellaceae cyanobacterium]|jgi:curved DNA-binding protein CbpA